MKESLSSQGGKHCLLLQKNTISTTLYTAYTFYSVYTVYTVCTVYTVDTDICLDLF